MVNKVMKSSSCFYSQHGTKKYTCEWMGEWTAEELINWCDGGSGNYGGRIDNFQDLGNENYKGIVVVYYD